LHFLFILLKQPEIIRSFQRALPDALRGWECAEPVARRSHEFSLCSVFIQNFEPALRLKCIPLSGTSTRCASFAQPCSTAKAMATRGRPSFFIFSASGRPAGAGQEKKEFCFLVFYDKR